MEVSTEIDINQAFVLKPNQVRNLLELLDKNIGNTIISTECEDAIKRKFDDADLLLDYSNISKSMIQSLSLWAKSEDGDKSARIVFRNQGHRPIIFGAWGEEVDVLNLKDRFSDFIISTKPWYNRLATIKIGFMVIAIGIVFALLSLLISAILIVKYGTKVDSSTSTDMFNGIFFGGGLFITLLFIEYFLSKFQAKLFPIGTFYWGHAAEKYNTLEKVRWTVVIGFLVSLAASILFWLFAWLFTSS